MPYMMPVDPRSLLFLLLSLCFGLFLLSQAQAETITGRASVIDGDTLEIAATRIRLHGVDAPESSQTCTDSRGSEYRCGQKAALALADKIGSRPVTCNARDTDRYGRTVAVCSQRDADLNAWLVAEGHAVAYRQFSKDYVPLENAARAAKRGIWAGSFTPPAEYRRRGNKESEASPDYWTIGRVLRIIEKIVGLF